MKKYLLIIGTYLIRGLLHLFCIFPVKKNRIIFNSKAWRQYSCNPRYITEYLQKNYPEKYDIVWAFREPEKFQFLAESGIKLCKTRTLKFYYYSMTSKISVTNATSAAEIPKRRGQYRINTWHGGGGGYKKIDYSGSIAFRPHLEMKETDLFCTSSETSLKFTVRQAFHHDGEYFKGTPRNDMLVNGDRTDLKKTVFDFFHLSPDTHIALYAPTFREGKDLRHKSKAYDYGLDYFQLQKALTEKFGGKWIVAIRFHTKITEYQIPESDKIIDATPYPDMQDLLTAVDVLLTDYSSSIWDFSFTYKPCLLFCSDLKEYEEKRGFNKPIRTWGFPIAQTNEELTEQIMNWNQEDFIQKMEHHHEENGSFEDGTATKRLCELIDKKCFG
ncbi:MAG: CDP-glycerol glycerophosphotransferase family protein [Oscillospiraceae bacterium]|nr:CDP-glycerol glycerophosphotransferase family protein [Oscillospiraceae bacterium]